MPTRVLIIDDSVFMRSMLKSALTDAENIEVVGTAMNGLDGYEKIKSLKPHVVTLDVEMPGMDGIDLLRRIMAESPLPVVMVSTKTQTGARATIDALRIGAVECVAKPLGDKSATLESFRQRVIDAVNSAAASNRSRIGRKSDPIVGAPAVAGFPSDLVVAIGISAGGPATLHEMIPALPKEFPPLVITQHMPAGFTGPFAQRLSEGSKLDVKEAAEGDELRCGLALIAPGDRHLRIRRQGGALVAALDDGPKVSGFRPSVDVLFESVAATVADHAVGVIMTGMGCDGSVGVRLLKKVGAHTIAQDKETSVVYGMPKAAFETGCIDHVLPLPQIPHGMITAIREITAHAGCLAK